jgi:AcrR family transcriptional regulator
MTEKTPISVSAAVSTPTPAPRRSDATRAAILEAARARFAADGFDKATIRAIAAQAGADPALVMRYYGNKEKLFATAAEFDLGLPDLTTLPRADIGRVLVTHFLDRWEEDGTLQALLRTAVTNEAAAERMRHMFATQVGPRIAALYPDPRAAMPRAGLVGCQILGVALCRYLLKLPAVAKMKREDLIHQAGPAVQKILDED